MATNVSYASNDTVLEALVLHTLPDFGSHGNGIINNNFLLAALNENGRKEVVEGGLEFWNGVFKQENTNFKWQGKTDDITANLQDPSDRLRWNIQTFTGAMVINKLDEARNKGRAMMKQWAKTNREQAESSIKNQFNSAFWNTSPGTDEPESIPSIISATPTAGTIGGLSRSGKKYLQNGLYSTSVADIGSEAGIAKLVEQKLKSAVQANDQVDLVLMGENLYSGLSAYLGTLYRYRPDNKMAELGFDTIKHLGMTISFENRNVKGGANTITDAYVYGINSKHLKFKLLRDGNFKWDDSFERVGLTLNKALYFWVFCNLTTDLPAAHFVMTNVATT